MSRGGWQMMMGEVRCGEVASVKLFYSPGVGATVNLGTGAVMLNQWRLKFFRLSSVEEITGRNR
jgi:hypothetical protein